MIRDRDECSPDKAKPFVRRGQKAAGLRRRKMAELPKDDFWKIRLF